MVTTSKSEKSSRRLEMGPAVLIGIVAALLSVGVVCFGAFRPVIQYCPGASPPTEVGLRLQDAAALAAQIGAFSHERDQAVQIAQQAVEATWLIDPESWPAVTQPLSELWNAAAIDNRTWQYKLHSLYILYDIIAAHQQTKNADFLHAGQHLIQSWEDCNLRSNPPSEFSWSDHSTANRAIAVCTFADYCHSVEPIGIEEQHRLAELLLQHGLFLAAQENYTSFHNHGIFQDYALLVIATHLRAGHLTEAWSKLAMRRLLEEVEWSYSSAGIHLENSPAYHFAVTALLWRVSEYMKSVGLKVPEPLEMAVNSAEREADNLVMPHGHIAPVGDTARGLAPSRYEFEQQTRPGVSQSWALYPEAGYCAVKNHEWGLFFAATNDYHAHKHRDDLTFLFGDQNGLVITDVGFLNYERSANREFSVSWRAHNTIVAETTKTGQESLTCGITSYGVSEGLAFVQGKSARNDGTVHVRTLLFDRSDSVLLVIDQCQGDDTTRWRRFFHFEPDIKLKDRDGTLAAERGNSRILTMAFWPHGVSRQVVTAQTEPLQGWVAMPFHGLVPAPALVETTNGPNVALVAAFVPGAHKVTLERPQTGQIRVTTANWTKSVALSDSQVQLVTESSDTHPGEKRTRERAIVGITRLGTEFQLPRSKPSQPCGLQRRLQVILLNGVAWAAVLLVLLGTKLKQSWLGSLFVGLCTVANAVAIWLVWAHF